MKNYEFEVMRDWMDLQDKNVYYLQGYLPPQASVKASIGKKNLKLTLKEEEEAGIFERVKNPDEEPRSRVTVTIQLPERLSHREPALMVFVDRGRESFRWFSVSVSEIMKKQEQLPFFIEEIYTDIVEKSCIIRGWAADTSTVNVEVQDERGNKIPCMIRKQKRADVAELYQGCEIDPSCGFYIEASGLNGRYFRLVMRSASRSAEYRFSLNKAVEVQQKISRYYEKGLRYLHRYGIRALTQKAIKKFKNRNNGPVNYQKWYLKKMPGAEELNRQREERFEYNPKFSIIVPVYKTPETYLKQLIRSLQNQTYENWELCISDGSGASSPIADYLKRAQAEDARIRVCSSEKPLKISDNTNRAMDMAEGEFLAFADHDDLLTADALYECARVLNENRDIDVIYTDEDKISESGRLHFQPNFKPDFNIDLLCSVNYICHLFVVRKSLQREAGIFRHEFDGAQDYDFIFRCVEKTEKIYHIPKILYHWRSHENSTALDPDSKEYAFEAGLRAIQAHYDRMGIDARAYKGEYPGLYRTQYKLDPQPFISILIPNKDHAEDLKRCIDSIETKSAYKNYEYIIIENNSTEEKTFQFYQELEKKNPRVRVVYYKGKFNYSAINNFGAGYAKGEYLWLLNNDTEIINADCIEELVGYCTRDDVGIVGARLYYGDDTIQHAGVVIGFGGIAGHCFVQMPRSATGYCRRIICAQDYSAVTAACMMVKRSVFDEVGGLSEELEVAFNDIDFCMKVRETGKLVVYNPYAELYHYESKSRGLEDTPEKIRRFQREIATFSKKWPDILKNGDPYYNPNLTLESQDFSLKRLK